MRNIEDFLPKKLIIEFSTTLVGFAMGIAAVGVVVTAAIKVAGFIAAVPDAKGVVE